MNDFKLTINQNTVTWDSLEVSAKLEGLSKLHNKSTAFIRADLTTVNSSLLGRIFWTLIAKYFESLREYFYGVNLEQSKEILRQLSVQVQVCQNPALLSLFNTALSNFNKIAPAHKLTYLKLASPAKTKPSPSAKSQTPIKFQTASRTPIISPTEVQSSTPFVTKSIPLGTGSPSTPIETKHLKNVIATPTSPSKFPAKPLSAPIKLKTLTQLIEEYLTHGTIKYDERRLQSLFKAHNEMFSQRYEYNRSTERGVIEKRDLPEGTTLFVRGDLHGDSETLVKTLVTLKDQDLLDKDFRCKPKTHVVFEGDYADKGKNTLMVIELLMCFRMGSPENVTLLLGNHDSIGVNKFEQEEAIGDECFRSFLGFGPNPSADFYDNQEMLQSFNETLLLALYLAQKVGGTKEYVLFTHALPELYVDPQDLLNSDCDNCYLPVPRMPYRSLEEMISNVADEKLKKLIEDDVERSKEDTTYCWGNIAEISEMGNPGNGEWSLNLLDIYAFLKHWSDQGQKIKYLFNSHQHAAVEYSINGKAIASTLSVACNTSYDNTEDVSCLLQIAPKVKNWKKRICLQELGKTMTIEEPNPLQEITIAHLIDKYKRHWNPVSRKFEGLKFDETRFVDLMKAYNEMFKPQYNPATAHGIIRKIDVPKGTKIFVRADVHGDLKSVLENLLALRSQGVLDEDFKCMPGVHFIFLGDLMDRGSNVMEVLELLMRFHMNNHKNITIIHGNHEDLELNKDNLEQTNDPNFRAFFANYDNQELLAKFYESLPLSLYVGTKNDDRQRQYVQFTHGLFELYVDPSELLDSEESYLAVSKNRIFPPRFSRLGAKEVSENPQEKKQNKQIQAAKAICGLWEQEKQRKHGLDITIYNWGDVNDRSQFGDPGERAWSLTTQAVAHYLYLSGDQHKVKLLYRGHQHKMAHHAQNEVLKFTTLPIAMDVDPFYCAQVGGDQPDRSYILTTDDKVKNWTKQALLRVPGESVTTVTAPHPIRDTAV